MAARCLQKCADLAYSQMDEEYCSEHSGGEKPSEMTPKTILMTSMFMFGIRLYFFTFVMCLIRLINCLNLFLISFSAN